MQAVETLIRQESPLVYSSEEVKLSSKLDIKRDLIRYAFCLGDHIEPRDKHQLKEAGAWAGGLWVGHSEENGCPTLKRTNYMIYRGGLIPLETTAIPKKADHRAIETKDENYLEGKDIPPGTRGYTVYSGDDMNFLQSDRFRPMGVVDITPLIGKEWATGEAMAVQLHFFPEWTIWANGDRQNMPSTLVQWEDLIRIGDKKANSEFLQIIASEMMESGRLFRQYANNQIERNRQAILSTRSTDTGGLYVNWVERTRLYAKQLGITLEDETKLSQPESNTGLVQELKEDRKLREEELKEQRRMNDLLIQQITNNPGTPSGGQSLLKETGIDLQDKVQEIVVESEEEKQLASEESISTGTSDEKIWCERPNNDGSQCNGYVKPGAKQCSRHLAITEKESK